MKLENLNADVAAAIVAPEAPISAPAVALPQVLVAPPESLSDPRLPERQVLEIALLNARVQHLELVVETARSLMSSNQERLLRRLYEVPREISEIAVQLRRLDGLGSPAAL